MIPAIIFALLLTQPPTIGVQMSSITLRHLDGVQDFVGVRTASIQITPKARLFDEFTVVDLDKSHSQHPLLSRVTPDSGGCESCDVTARLDNLAIQLQNDPTTTAFIIVLTTRNESILSKAQKTALLASAN